MESKDMEIQKTTNCKAHKSKVQFFKKQNGKLEFLCEQCVRDNVGKVQVKSIKGMRQELERTIDRYEKSIKSSVVERMDQIIGKSLGQIKIILNGQFQLLQQRDIQMSFDSSRVEDWSEDECFKVNKWENTQKMIEEINNIAQRNEITNQQRLVKINQFFFFIKNSQYWLQQAINHLSKIHRLQSKTDSSNFSPLLTQITKLIMTNQQQSQRQVSCAYQTISKLKQQILYYQHQLQSNSIIILTLEQQLKTRIHNYQRIQKELHKPIESISSSPINDNILNQLSILTRKFNDCKELLFEKDTLLMSKKQIISQITKSYEELKQQYEKQVVTKKQYQRLRKLSQSKNNQNKSYIDELEEQINKMDKLNKEKDETIQQNKQCILKLEEQNSLQLIELQRLLNIIKDLKSKKQQKIQQKQIEIKKVDSLFLQQNNEQKCDQNQIQIDSKEIHISFGKDSIASIPIDISIQQKCPKILQQSSFSNSIIQTRIPETNLNSSNFSKVQELQKPSVINQTHKYQTSYQKLNQESMLKKQQKPLVKPRDHNNKQFSTTIQVQEQEQNIEKEKSNDYLINEIDQMTYGGKKSINKNHKSYQDLNQYKNIDSQQKSLRGSAKIQNTVIQQRKQSFKPFESNIFKKSNIISDQTNQLRLLNCFFEQQMSINSSKLYYSTISSKMDLHSVNNLLNSSKILILTLSKNNIIRGLYFRVPLNRLNQSTQKSKLPLLLMHAQTQNIFLKLIENRSSYSEIILHFVRQDNPQFSFTFTFFKQQAKVLLQIKIIEKNRISLPYQKQQLQRIQVLQIFQLQT